MKTLIRKMINAMNTGFKENDSTAQICVDCDMIWLQVNQ